MLLPALIHAPTTTAAATAATMTNAPATDAIVRCYAGCTDTWPETFC
jgi:hypothetical protein